MKSTLSYFITYIDNCLWFRLFSRGYFVGLNLCLILLGLLRPIYLFADPYNLGDTWPRYCKMSLSHEMCPKVAHITVCSHT